MASRRACSRPSISSLALLILAPACGRRSGASPPKALSACVRAPLLPRNRAFACSRAARSIVRSKVDFASAIMPSRFSISLRVRLEPALTRATMNKKGGLTASFRLRFSDSGAQARFSLTRNPFESGLIEDGNVREHLAIDLDRGFLQAIDQGAVGHAEFPRGRVDANDPQRAKIALLAAAVAIRVLTRAHDRLFGDSVNVAASAPKAFRFLENFLMPRS